MAEIVYPSWPAGIGDRPLIDGLTRQDIKNEEVFQVEQGEGFELSRPIHDGALFDMTATYPVSAADYPRLLAWWQDEVKSGALRFWLHCPFSTRARLWKKAPGSAAQTAFDGPLWRLFTVTLRSAP